MVLPEPREGVSGGSQSEDADALQKLGPRRKGILGGSWT